MRTLWFKSEFKQKENSLETIEIFVPLAYYIGAYRIKSELEDISFGYLYPKEYKNIEERLNNKKLELKIYMEYIKDLTVDIRKYMIYMIYYH